MTPNPETATGTSEVTVSRVFDAPRELMWKVWTEPEHATQWWGPDGFTNPVYEADLRPGGKLVRHMHGPNGNVAKAIGIFDEVVEPERLVTSGELEMAGEFAFDIRTTVTFEAQGSKTLVTVHQAYSNVRASFDAAEGARGGWSQTFARLEAYLDSLSEGKAGSETRG